jgi:hypothetical protein
MPPLNDAPRLVGRDPFLSELHNDVFATVALHCQDARLVENAHCAFRQ